MKDVLKRIIAGEELSQAETHQIMLNIVEQRYADVQIAAFLTALEMRGVTVDELLGLRDGLLDTGKQIDLSPFEPIDIVGTGGDGKNTFNISTCACFVVAGAGYKVAKHGNYASTSVSGASNVIEAHGVKFCADEDRLREALDKVGIVYLHAPLFASGMKAVAPTRKGLAVPTCFNILGPLVNPCRPKNQLLGVATLKQLRLYSRVYERLGINYGIVNSIDGYDEVSLTGDFKIKTNGYERIITPEEVGFARISAEEIYGGATLDDARKVFDNVLTGSALRSQTDVAIANAAMAIRVLDASKSVEDCVAMARESIESGKAYEKLKQFVEFFS
ncbi:MAG: anthranilate phosphoribosyltransferase [Muribaculaceae bacterium]